MHSAQMQAAVLEGCRFGRPTSDSRSLAFIRGSQNVAVTCTLSVRRAGGFLLTVKCKESLPRSPDQTPEARAGSVDLLQATRMTWPSLIESSASVAAGINGRRSASLFVGAHKTTIEIFRKVKFC
jgi:hypothetical protein